MGLELLLQDVIPVTQVVQLRQGSMESLAQLIHQALQLQNNK